MIRLLFVLLGYAFGLIQTAYIVGRYYKIDMREHGSKNLGTTNALRTLGAKAGGLVFLCDVLKSVLAILTALLICYFISGPEFFTKTNYSIVVLYTGFGVMLGHNYPFYLGFKGGKGVACSIGTILMFNPIILLIAFIMGIIVIYFSRYISLASIICCVATVVLSYLFGYRGEPLYLLMVIATFILWKHRANIKRLIDGNENKFSIKKKVEN